MEYTPRYTHEKVLIHMSIIILIGCAMIIVLYKHGLQSGSFLKEYLMVLSYLKGFLHSCVCSYMDKFGYFEVMGFSFILRFTTILIIFP